MAMASEFPGPGGKVGGFDISKQCDLCDSTTPVKYCPECEFTLCPACAKGHKRIQTTKSHSLVDIGKLSSGAPYDKSGEGESGPSPCKTHPKHALELYCEECVLLICQDCRQDHKGHSVQPLDLKTYHNICTQHIKHLLDKTQDLEEYKRLIKECFTSYDDAMQMVRRWEEELVKLVKESSRSLIEDLETAKKEYDVVNDEDKGLATIAEDVDKKLSKLTSIRKVTDFDIFSNELAASQQLLEKVKHFIDNILPTLTVPTMDDLLPNASQFLTIKMHIKDLMSTREVKTAVVISLGSPRKQTPQESARTSAHYKYPVQKHEFPNLDAPSLASMTDINDPDSKWGYRINESYNNKNKLMIHGFCRKDIRLVNLDNKTLNRLTGNVEMENIISTGNNKYVTLGSGSLYLVNSKFEIVHRQTTDKYCRAVSYISDDMYLLLETAKNNKKYTAHLSVVKIRNDRFTVTKQTSLRVKKEVYFLATDENKQNVFMGGYDDFKLYRVNLADWTTKHIDLTERFQTSLWSLCVVDDHLLAGSHQGQLHLFDTELNYKKVILRIQGSVRDIAVKNGYLIVTSVNNKIYLYK